MSYFRFYIALVIVLLACDGENTVENRAVVVEGHLYAGAISQNIKLSYPKQQGFPETVIDRAVVTVYNDFGKYDFTHIGGGIYAYTSPDLEIVPARTYKLVVLVDGRNIYASTTVPSLPQGLEVNRDTLSINVSTVDFLMFSWCNPSFEYYSPVVRSVSTHSDNLLNEIVDKFNFAYPTSDSGKVVAALNVTHLGQNEFILYSITNEYLRLFGFEEVGTLSQADNIIGGEGIFTSYSSDTVRFFVE